MRNIAIILTLCMVGMGLSGCFFEDEGGHHGGWHGGFHDHWR
jgi:hypothetical protein